MSNVPTEIRDNERKQAETELLAELMKADESVRNKGWVSEEDADTILAN